jgi:protease-4
MAREALSNGLVDSLGYEDQAVENLKNRLKQDELKTVSAKSYVNAPLPSRSGTAHRIALVVGEGQIMQGSGNESANDQNFTAAGFIKLLKQVENDSDIRGVILRVNSPGGDGVASDDILHQVQILSKKKPLVISMSDLAASGGYFVSMTGDPIVAYPNTLTGSIGVIYARANLQGLYEKVGVTKQLITRGRYATIDSEYAMLSEDERKKIADQIDAFYRAFVARVAAGRKKPFDQVEPLAQGRVWLGAQAKRNGLVDELGGLDRAVQLVRQKARIPDGDRITLVPYPGKRSVFDLLFRRSDETAEIPALIARLLGDLPLGSLARGGFLKLMPYSIGVR